MIFNIAAHKQLPILSGDTKNAFPQAGLQELVYCKVPFWFHKFISQQALNIYREEYGDLQYMLQMKRSLYGMCQSGYNYVSRHRKRLQAMSYAYSEADPCLFVLNKPPHYMLVGAFVDDEIHVSTHKTTRANYMKKLLEIQPIEDLGMTTSFLGMRVTQEKDAIYMDMENYITTAALEFDLHTSTEHYKARHYSVPCTPDILDLKGATDLSKVDPHLRKQQEKIMGVLSYASFRLRDDVKVATSILSRTTSRPTEELHARAKIALKYLLDHATLRVKFEKGQDMHLVAYTDSSFANHTETRKSLGGHALFFGENKLMSSNGLHKTISLSSSEAEFIELTNTVKDVLHARRMLRDVGFEQKSPTIIYVDNTTALAWSTTDLLYIPRRRHLDISLKWLEEIRAAGHVKFEYVDTKNNKADFLSKPLGRKEFIRQRAYYLVE